MVDIALLPVGTLATYTNTDATGEILTGVVVGRVMKGSLEGEVDLDDRQKDDQKLDRVKLRFVDKLGRPPEYISISCHPNQVSLFEEPVTYKVAPGGLDPNQWVVVVELPNKPLGVSLHATKAAAEDEAQRRNANAGAVTL